MFAIRPILKLLLLAIPAAAGVLVLYNLLTLHHSIDLRAGIQLLFRRLPAILALALVCALLTAGLGWVPVLGWVLWLSAIALSLTGLTRAPRWQACVALVLTAAVTVEALLFAVVGSRAVHSLFSFLAGY